jgi:hypothetical protein
MTANQIAIQALQLPVKDRASLAASLWESIEDPYALDVERSDKEALNLAFARDLEIDAGVAAAIPHAELMRRLRG